MIDIVPRAVIILVTKTKYFLKFLFACQACIICGVFSFLCFVPSPEVYKTVALTVFYRVTMAL